MTRCSDEGIDGLRVVVEAVEGVAVGERRTAEVTRLARGRSRRCVQGEVLMARAHVVMSDETLREIDRLVGERSPSRFLEEAAREKRDSRPRIRWRTRPESPTPCVPRVERPSGGRRLASRDTTYRSSLLSLHLLDTTVLIAHRRGGNGSAARPPRCRALARNESRQHRRDRTRHPPEVAQGRDRARRAPALRGNQPARRPYTPAVTKPLSGSAGARFTRPAHSLAGTGPQRRPATSCVRAGRAAPLRRR